MKSPRRSTRRPPAGRRLTPGASVPVGDRRHAEEENAPPVQPCERFRPPWAPGSVAPVFMLSTRPDVRLRVAHTLDPLHARATSVASQCRSGRGRRPCRASRRQGLRTDRRDHATERSTPRQLIREPSSKRDAGGARRPEKHKRRCEQRLSKSPLPDSNRRPLPHHPAFSRYLRELNTCREWPFAGLSGLSGLARFR